ncbi:DUF4235 domain-containing protein [Algoriphagus halophytocola]|uniref:DUF4235 domain-containing protein n=1 Tax=Algoriphagus halophytocola TaxID=2991499 RepID=A0ABY6MMX9_9BACT|nr:MULTISPECIES: DUF4235 domain-containing protein [unclassified Algoriphagus]UZD23559.1 DUF4235 domain-containing protein [Algoriphagus sp. TR-M5]WBL44853.1 DUF4235 domain-containing protein [Algoriphagus sp. TR-M9]
MNLSENKFTILSAALSIGVAALAKAAIANRYQAITGEPAPKNPESKEASFGKVVLYTAITAAVGVSAKILVRKFFTKEWKKMDGDLPRHLK